MGTVEHHLTRGDEGTKGPKASLAKLKAPAGGAIVNNQQVRGGGFMPRAFERIRSVVARMKGPGGAGVAPVAKLGRLESPSLWSHKMETPVGTYTMEGTRGGSNNDMWKVKFSHDDDEGKDAYALTGRAGHQAVHVMRAAHEGLHEFLRTVKPEYVSIHAAADEDSRVRLYDRVIPRLAQAHGYYHEREDLGEHIAHELSRKAPSTRLARQEFKVPTKGIYGLIAPDGTFHENAKGMWGHEETALDLGFSRVNGLSALREAQHNHGYMHVAPFGGDLVGNHPLGQYTGMQLERLKALAREHGYTGATVEQVRSDGVRRDLPLKLSRHWTPEEAEEAHKILNSPRRAANRKEHQNLIAASMANRPGVLPTIHELKAAALAGTSARGEYASSFKRMSSHVGPRRARLWVALNAVMSPQVGWEKHTHEATKALANWVGTGEPDDEAGQAKAIHKVLAASAPHIVYGNKKLAVARVLKAHADGEDPLHPKMLVKSGIGKVANFAQAFHHPGGVPIDTHMMRLVAPKGFKGDDKALLVARQALASKPHFHLAYKQAIGHVADELHWEPREVQESVWATVRALQAAKYTNPANPHAHMHHEAIRSAWDMGATMNTPEVQHELKRLGIHQWPGHAEGLTGPAPTEGLESVTERLGTGGDQHDVGIRRIMAGLGDPEAF